MTLVFKIGVKALASANTYLLLASFARSFVGVLWIHILWLMQMSPRLKTA